MTKTQEDITNNLYSVYAVDGLRYVVLDRIKLRCYVVIQRSIKLCRYLKDNMTCYGIDMDKNETVTVVLKISNLLFVPFKPSEDQLSTG